LRAGSFADKTAAQNACAELKKQGLTDCIAKER
jgi:cell division protein FtsN